jgi:hypothetical protein
MNESEIPAWACDLSAVLRDDGFEFVSGKYATGGWIGSYTYGAAPVGVVVATSSWEASVFIGMPQDQARCGYYKMDRESGAWSRVKLDLARWLVGK